MSDGTQSRPVRTDGFFSRQHVVPVLWALVLATSGYVFAKLDPWEDEPKHVIVQNAGALAITDSPPQEPIVVSMEPRVLEELGSIRDSLRETENALSDLARSARLGERNNQTAVLQNAVDELERLREQLKDEGSTAGEVAAEAPSGGATFDQFRLISPSVVDGSAEAASRLKGYTLASASKLRGIKCPSYDRQTKRLLFNFEIPKELASRIAYFTLTVSEIHGPLSHSLLSEYRFDLNAGRSDVEQMAELSPGNYDVTLGYFLKADLKAEYPALHGLSCTISV